MMLITEGLDSDHLDGGKLYCSHFIRGAIHISYWDCYDSSPIYTYFLTLLTYDTPPESPYSSGPPTGLLGLLDWLMLNPCLF